MSYLKHQLLKPNLAGQIPQVLLLYKYVAIFFKLGTTQKGTPVSKNQTKEFNLRIPGLQLK